MAAIPRSGRTDAASELEEAMGWAIAARVRALRADRGFTLGQLADRSGVSKPMLSKIENGQTSTSLTTLARLATGLNVPVTTFFRDLAEESDEAVFVPAGEGPEIVREGTRVGHRYQLLGAPRRPFTAMEPVLVSMNDDSEVFPLFQHPGIEMIYMLEGRLEYSHGTDRYILAHGDTLLFRGEVAHGPSALLRVPIRFLSVKLFAADDRAEPPTL